MSKYSLHNENLTNQIITITMRTYHYPLKTTQLHSTSQLGQLSVENYDTELLVRFLMSLRDQTNTIQQLEIFLRQMSNKDSVKKGKKIKLSAYYISVLYVFSLQFLSLCSVALGLNPGLQTRD